MTFYPDLEFPFQPARLSLKTLNRMSENRSASGDSGRRERQRGLSPAHLILLVLLVAGLAILTVNVVLLARFVERQANTNREHYFWVLCQPGHSAAERLEAFQALVAGGNKEWRSADLSDLKLEGVALPGVELQFAGFQRADLARANLTAARLNKAALGMADLTSADLTEADLAEAQMYRVNLKAAKLHRAKLRAAVLQEVEARNADFMVADLSEADCLMANLTGANLSGANLSGARLEAVIFKDANLSLARLDGAILKDADFTDSNWWHARGLTGEQMDEMKKRFAPSESAPASLKADFEKWLNQGSK